MDAGQAAPYLSAACRHCLDAPPYARQSPPVPSLMPPEYLVTTTMTSLSPSLSIPPRIGWPAVPPAGRARGRNERALRRYSSTAQSTAHEQIGIFATSASPGGNARQLGMRVHPPADVSLAWPRNRARTLKSGKLTPPPPSTSRAPRKGSGGRLTGLPIVRKAFLFPQPSPRPAAVSRLRVLLHNPFETTQVDIAQRRGESGRVAW